MNKMTTKPSLQPLKGFRDFYPEDLVFQKWFYEKVRKVSESFGFQEYEGPILEPLDLYAAKSGEELVKKQAFTLKDQSGKTIALRPEMTPSLARMIAQKANELVFPVKWFTYGRRFRYEKPQRGRGREFFQWDIDILGLDNLEADAEIITIAATLYQKIGLTPEEVKIKVNDRVFCQENLLRLGINQKQITPIFRIIDKKGKVSSNVFQEMLAEEKLSKKQINGLLTFLEDKSTYRQSPWLSKILDLINQTGLISYVEYDPVIVRGLDYYTRTVFEGWDVKGEFRSIWGGGRYDNLTAEVGSIKKIPGVGFAMGDMVIYEILKENNKLPSLPINQSTVLVTVFSVDQFEKSQEISLMLRQKNINTELYLEPNTRLDKQLKYADKKGIPLVIIVGPEEINNNLVALKNLKTGDQVKVPLETAIEIIKK